MEVGDWPAEAVAAQPPVGEAFAQRGEASETIEHHHLPAARMAFHFTRRRALKEQATMLAGLTPTCIQPLKKSLKFC